MSDELFTTVRQLAKDGKIPDEITPEITFALIADTHVMVSDINGTVKGVKGDVDKLKREWEENPSLIYLLRNKTSKTVKTLFTIFLAIVFVAAVLAASEPLREWVAGILGLI
jgi:hypothetical protein